MKIKILSFISVLLMFGSCQKDKNILFEQEIFHKDFISNTKSLKFEVTPESFGAVGDGIHDDTYAIQAAIYSGASRIILGDKTYLIKSFDLQESSTGANFALNLPNNIEITGSGKNSIIKVGNNTINNLTINNIRGSCLFLAKNKTEIRLKNFLIDMNGENNLALKGKSDKYAMLGYAFLGLNLTKSCINNVIIKNTSGRNSINLRGGYCDTIKYCKIINGGTSIEGNELQDDYSAIYVASSNSNIHGNIIKHDFFPFTYSGGIELHASYIKCTDNYIERSFPACYIFTDNENSLVEGTSFDYNDIYDCYSGVIIGGKGNFDHLYIRNNDIYLRRSKFNKIHSNEHCYGIKQNDNTNPITESYFQFNNIYDNDFPVNIAHFINITACNVLLISNNFIKNMSGEVFLIGGNGDIIKLYIYQNQISNFGNIFPFNHYSFSLNITSGNADGIFVTHNTIEKKDINYNDYGYYFNWSSNSNINNLTFAYDKHINVWNIKGGPKSSLVTIKYLDRSFN